MKLNPVTLDEAGIKTATSVIEIAAWKRTDGMTSQRWIALRRALLTKFAQAPCTLTGAEAEETLTFFHASRCVSVDRGIASNFGHDRVVVMNLLINGA